MPDIFIGAIDSWVCGAFSLVGFEGDELAGIFKGYKVYASSSHSYIYNTDMRAASIGPMTRGYVLDYAHLESYLLYTTIFDQPSCSGTISARLSYFVIEGDTEP